MADSDFTHLNGVYKEMAELLGYAAALKIWNRYAGVIVSFPKQLYSKEHVRQFIRENSGKMKPSSGSLTIISFFASISILSQKLFNSFI